MFLYQRILEIMRICLISHQLAFSLSSLHAPEKSEILSESYYMFGLASRNLFHILCYCLPPPAKEVMFSPLSIFLVWW